MQEQPAPSQYKFVTEDYQLHTVVLTENDPRLHPDWPKGNVRLHANITVEGVELLSTADWPNGNNDDDGAFLCYDKLDTATRFIVVNGHTMSPTGYHALDGMIYPHKTWGEYLEKHPRN